MLWRCYAEECGGHDFTSEPGQPVVCPNCQRDRKEPENANVIVKRETIHLLVKAPKVGPIIGHGHRYAVACKPSQKTTGEHCRISGEPGAVTCPACRDTEAWQGMMEENSFSGEAPTAE